MSKQEAEAVLFGTSDKKPTRSEKKAATRAFVRAEEEDARKALVARAKGKLPEQLKKLGRPSSYNERQADIILARLSNGESLDMICQDKDMPAESTVFLWLQKEPSFSERYARAREAQAHVLFDQCLAIADDTSKDLIVTEDGDVTANPSAVARAKLQIETRFRMAGKLSPKVYGERSESVTSQVNVQVNALTVDARSLAPEQRESLRAMLLQARGDTLDG